MRGVNTQSNNRATEVVLTKNGHSIKAFKDDQITRRIKARGIYEGGALSLVAKVLRKIDSPVVLDIGANIGNHSLSFAMDAHKVYSFEPVKATFALLQENALRNDLTNLHCFNYGLSDVDALAEIFVDDAGNIGGSSLEHKGKRSTVEAIELVRGDGWVASSGNCIDKIDFVKVDVEGHEPKVLAGLKNALLKYRPIVMMEYNERPSIQAFREMDLFNEYFVGCEVFVLGNNYDHEYHEGKGYAKVRRFLTRLISKKLVKLYYFDPSRLYHNVLIVPKEKLAMLPRECLT